MEREKQIIHCPGGRRCACGWGYWFSEAFLVGSATRGGSHDQHGWNQLWFGCHPAALELRVLDEG